MIDEEFYLIGGERIRVKEKKNLDIYKGAKKKITNYSIVSPGVVLVSVIFLISRKI